MPTALTRPLALLLALAAGGCASAPTQPPAPAPAASAPALPPASAPGGQPPQHFGPPGERTDPGLRPPPFDWRNAPGGQAPTR